MRRSPPQSIERLVALTDAIDQAIRLTGVDPIAAVVVGSTLYNTVVDHHDLDVAVFVPTGKSVQLFEGDLDVKTVTLEFLLGTSSDPQLYETDAVLGLLYGYGRWYDHPWTPALRGFRPSIWGYANTVRRLDDKHPDMIKHLTRYDIFLERFWQTGNADPRLTDEERELWMEIVHGGT